MRRSPVTPKSMVVDLLRVAPERAAFPVRLLLQAGELFGFSAGSLRVAVTRLQAQGLVESDERGFYRLAPFHDPMHRFIERWRLGEERIRRWDGSWLALVHPRSVRRVERARSLRALGLVGFREGLPGLWVRPNNLRDDGRTRDTLHDLGLADAAELFVATGLSARTEERWRRNLWPCARLEARARALSAELARSSARLTRMPKKSALVESYLIGGEAIRVLVTDPLLPAQISDNEPRRALTAELVRYERVGRKLWFSLFEQPEAPLASAHLRLLRAGAS